MFNRFLSPSLELDANAPKFIKKLLSNFLTLPIFHPLP